MAAAIEDVADAVMSALKREYVHPCDLERLVLREQHRLELQELAGADETWASAAFGERYPGAAGIGERRSRQRVLASAAVREAVARYLDAQENAPGGDAGEILHAAAPCRRR